MIHTAELGLNSTSHPVSQWKALVKVVGLEGVGVDAEDN
jgi:hypothetical protein